MSTVGELTDHAAQQRMEAHHVQLVAAVDDAVAELEGACLDDDAAGARNAAARFQILLEESVLPHATGEERTLYAVAEALNGALVQSLTEEHDVLRDLIRACGALAGDLGQRSGRVAHVGLAHEVRALFRAHAHKEDSFVTPLLLRETPAGTLAKLFVDMHALPAGA